MSSRVSMMTLILLCGAGLGGCTTTARPPQVLQSWCRPSHHDMKPGVFTSPSQAFRLEIVPISNSLHPEDPPYPGSGGAKYRMTCMGREAWVGERDYALQDPLVTDDGTVVGVAYREEYENDKRWSYRGEFLHLVIIRDGHDVQDWMGERTQPPVLSNPPGNAQPLGEILVVDPANDRIIFVVRERDHTPIGCTACWLFRFSNGDFLSRIDFTQLLTTPGHADPNAAHPSIGFLIWVSELAVVEGTPLILVHCRQFNRAYSREGPWDIVDSLFILIDSDGKPLWSLLVPRNAAFAWKEESFLDGRRIWEPPHPLLITGEPGTFGIYRTWEDCVETYSVKNSGAEGWKVTNTGRTTLAKARREHGVESRPAPP